jgi:hypothetical protein
VTGDRRIGRPGATQFLAGALLGALVAVVAPASALAANGQVELVKLALSPIGQPGSYFDLTMRPGETRDLEVRIGNDGADALAARTYAADVYTIINGGFGARLRDEPTTGATQWLDYTTRVIDLPAGQNVHRSLMVAVPSNVEPGEYISSIVLENDQPLRGTGAVALDQIVRQAIAVVITVPGGRAPAMAIGGATHKVVAGKSTIAVAIRNTGNVRLKPLGDLTLFDASGAEVSRATIPMDTFYAESATLVEVPLAALLLPGRYTIRVTLDDAVQGVTATEPAIVLIVDAPEAAATGEGLVPGLTEVKHGSGDTPLALIPLVAALLAGIIIVAGIGRTVLLRRRPRA